MKISFRVLAAVVLLPLSVAGCLNMANTIMQQDNVLVSQVVTVCGAMVGGQAEQRINQEWAKYPGVEANRTIIETMANVLLSNPQATGQQGQSQYKQYMTCATGLLVANGMVK